MLADDGGVFLRELSAAQSGDAASMDSLLRRSRPALQRQAEECLGDRLRARVGPDDLVQQTLMEAARDLRAFTGSTEREFRAWLHGILRRNVLDVVKAQARTHKRSLGSEVSLDEEVEVDVNGVARSRWELIPDDQTSPSKKVARREVVMRIAHCMDKLSADQREAVRLSLTGHTAREIGERLGRTESAATSLLKRALEDLRNLIRTCEGNSMDL